MNDTPEQVTILGQVDGFLDGDPGPGGRLLGWRSWARWTASWMEILGQVDGFLDGDWLLEDGREPLRDIVYPLASLTTCAAITWAHSEHYVLLHRVMSDDMLEVSQLPTPTLSLEHRFAVSEYAEDRIACPKKKLSGALERTTITFRFKRT